MNQGLKQRKIIKIKNPDAPSQSQHISTSSVLSERVVVSSFCPVCEPTLMHLSPSLSLLSQPLGQMWDHLGAGNNLKQGRKERNAH